MNKVGFRLGMSLLVSAVMLMAALVTQNVVDRIDEKEQGNDSRED